MQPKFGGWFDFKDMKWEKGFEELSHSDFQKLGIEKDKLYSIMEQLYEWRVID